VDAHDGEAKALASRLASPSARAQRPLVGDLVEEWPRRSSASFWRQVMFAVFARVMTGASATLREPQRLGGELASVAICLILSFQVVVAGSLLDDLIRRIDHAQVTRINHPEWLMFVVILSLPVPWVIGRAMSRLHWRSRVATVLICGASAAVIASMTLSVLSSEATSSSFHQLHLKTQRQWCSCSGCWSAVRALLSTIDNLPLDLAPVVRQAA